MINYNKNMDKSDKTKKIINLLKKDTEISQVLFKFSSWFNEKRDLPLYINKNNKELVENTEWIYVSSSQKFTLIGIVEIKGKLLVQAIDEQCDYAGWIQAFKNIPYEFLRRRMFYEDDSTEIVLNDNPDYYNILKRYEKFCEDNHIVLDEEKVYHNASGEIFSEYFDLD